MSLTLNVLFLLKEKKKEFQQKIRTVSIFEPQLYRWKIDKLCWIVCKKKIFRSTSGVLETLYSSEPEGRRAVLRCVKCGRQLTINIVRDIHDGENLFGQDIIRYGSPSFHIISVSVLETEMRILYNQQTQPPIQHQYPRKIYTPKIFW